MARTKQTGRLRTLFLSCLISIAVCGSLGWGIHELLFPPTDVCAIEQSEGKQLLDIRQVYPIENNMELIGHWGGKAESVFVRGAILFAKLGLELAAFDTQNPADPRRIGYLLIPGNLIYVDETGHYAYILSSGESYGLWKVDVSNPARMSARHLYSTKFVIKGFRLLNEKAFVTTRKCEYTYFFEGSIETRCDDTLHVVDTKDTSSPAQCYQGLAGNLRALAIANAPELIPAPQTAIQGNYRYDAKGKDGLRVYNVSNPIQPLEVSSYASPSELIDISVYKTQALATSVQDQETGTRYALQTFDVEIPTDPKHQGELSSKPIVIAEFDRYAVLKEQFAYGSWPLGVEILDRSSPESGNAREPAQIAQLVDMVVHEMRGYGLTDDNRFLLLDMSDIENPVILASHTLRSPYHPGYRLSVMGSYAYIIVSDLGMRVLDISDKENILEVATYPMKTPPVEITVNGHYAYVAEWYGTLEIVDISNPTSPTLVHVYDAQDRIDAMQVVKNYLFMTGGDPGLQVIDISDPTAPDLVGSFDTDTFVTGLDVECPYIYISDIENGIFILKSNLISAEACQ
jgi:hypothetical protein